MNWGPNSWVNIVARLRDWWLKKRSSSTGRVKRFFSFLQWGRISSGSHSASYLVDIGGCVLGNKTAGTWRWQLTSIMLTTRRRGVIPRLIRVPSYGAGHWALGTGHWSLGTGHCATMSCAFLSGTAPECLSFISLTGSNSLPAALTALTTLDTFTTNVRLLSVSDSLTQLHYCDSLRIIPYIIQSFNSIRCTFQITVKYF